MRLSARPGKTGGRPANFGGISISALLMSTATGLRSEACASSPRRWASSGIVPPPANGSRIGGGLPPVDLRISACASASSASSRDVLPDDEPLDDAVQPLALGALSLLGRELSGCDDGSSTSWANSTARAAASGRRAHHRCSVDGWPWRIDFSRADSRLIVSSGSATSISLRFGAPTASSFASVVIELERLPASRPGRLPLAAVAGRVEVAGVEAGERVLEVADLVVLGAARVDAHEREAVARRAVERRQHLVVGDEEVLGAGDAGLDLDPDRVLAVALRRGRRSRGC